MVKEISSFTKNMNLNSGASKENLQSVQDQLGILFPNQYLDWLRVANGGEGFVGQRSYLILWSVEDIIPLNEAYSVEEFAPGLVLIGSDGGDTAYAFDTRNGALPIIELPFIGMDRDKIKKIGNDFIEFLHYLETK